MNRMLTNAFLRLYGFNLGRKFRNSPAQACSDAVMQIVMLLMVPVGVVLGLLTSLLPETYAAIRLRNFPFIVFAVGFVLPTILWVAKRFAHYKYTPEAANSFRSTRERRKSMELFVVVVLLIAVSLGLASCGLR